MLDFAHASERFIYHSVRHSLVSSGLILALGKHLVALVPSQILTAYKTTVAHG